MSLLGLVAALLAGPAAAVEVPTGDAGHAQNPVWSRSGDYLAYEINSMASSVELWIVTFEGGRPGAPKQLVIPGLGGSFGGSSGVLTDPTWTESPETMVIFEGGGGGGDLRLYFAYPGRGAPAELLQASQLGGNLTFPEISADGGKLAFVSDATGAGDIYLWDIPSNALGPIFQSGETEHFPAFSPDASAMVFSRKNQGTEDLFTWTGGSTTPGLTGGAGDQTRPVWVGDRIVFFTSERGEGQWDIAVSGTTAGSPRTTVASGVRLPARAAPAITPDGRAVAWTSADPTRGDRIFITPLDGSAGSEIATGLVACGEPSLVQAGGRTWLAFTALPGEGSDWRRLHVIDVTGKY